MSSQAGNDTSSSIPSSHCAELMKDLLRCLSEDAIMSLGKVVIASRNKALCPSSVEGVCRLQPVNNYISGVGRDCLCEPRFG